MEYKIKSKLIDGEVKFGIINDKLEVVLPFKYSNIEEKTFERKNWSGSSSKSYYILSNSNNKKGIFLNDGKSLIEPIYDYIDYIPLFDNEYWSKFIVGKQNEDKMEYGILERQGSSGTYKLVYPFGKADEIKIEDGKVLLYKNKGNRVLRGIFKDSQLGTFDPKYTQLNLGISKPKYKPIMPDPKDVFVDKSATWSFGFQEWPIEYIMYGKIKNRKEVRGILVRNGKDDWNELVPCEYSNYSIDTSENLIKLSQVKNKRELKGLMGFSTYWNISTQGSVVHGNCTYKPEFTIPCEYDYISLLYGVSEIWKRTKKKFFLVKKHEKYGLLKVCYSFVRGPYDNSYNYKPAASIEILLECKYDNISLLSSEEGQSFVFTSDGKKGLLIDSYGYYDKNRKALQTNCEYKSIVSISDGYHKKFVITNFDDKKSVFVPYKIEENVYEFKHTPFEYNNILLKEILQCSKKVDETQFYDIYDSSLDLIVANADSVNFEDSMYKVSKNIDENNTRITFVDKNGNVLLDEQGENISATYSKKLGCFFILRNNIIQIKKSQNQRTDEREFDIQGDYTIFDFVDSCFVKFKRATENSKMGIYKFVRDNWSGRNKITILLKDEYENIDIVGNGTRSIVSKIISNDVPRTKYGVMENNIGNECIPIEYDSIIFDGENFIASNCENGEIKQIKFDSDGFYLNSETFESQEKKVLQLNQTSKH